MSSSSGSGSWRRVALRADTYGFAERPALGKDVLAVGYSGHQSDAGPSPVVDVLDIDGSPGFTIHHEAVGREIEVCEPKIASGVVRAAVYEHDIELIVYAAYTDGTLLARTSLGCEYPIYGADMGSKLRTQIEPCPDGGFLVTYCYRARTYYVGKYRDGVEEPAWSADEWMIAATREHALCAAQETDHKLDREALVCRRKLDGEIAWQLEPAMIDVAATTSDAVLLVDRADRFAEKTAHEADVIRRATEDDASFTDEEIERAFDASPTAPTIVRLVDAATGVERWRREVAGDVFAACASEDGLASWMTTDPTGRGQLWTNRAQAPLPIRGHVSSAWPPNIGREPVIVGHVDGRVVWADEARLHVCDAAVLDRATSLPLPGSIGGFFPRGRERSLAKANAALGAGHVYLRRGDELWIAELP